MPGHAQAQRRLTIQPPRPTGEDQIPVNPTPAGHEPNRPPTDGTLAPTAPGAPYTKQAPLTKTQKTLTAVVVGAVLVIATLGFIGSYTAVTHLAQAKHFGKFSHAFPIAVDAGIIAFLALDLLLTWRRIAFPLLRYTAWGLTAATIAFNAATAWPDWLGVSMHGTIPVLFVIAVEAARHAIGRIADITADKHLEGPNASRWLLNPAGTFILWRRQRLWAIRQWDTVLDLERERRIYIGQLRGTHGRAWRRKATAEQLLILRLATKNGMSITEAVELPAREAEKRRAEADRITREQQQAEDERRRAAEAYEREQQRLADEAARRAEDERLEAERKALALAEEKAEAARRQQIADAETAARLAEIARREQAAAAQADAQRRAGELEHARALAAEQQKAAAAATARKDAEEAARVEAERKLDASRRAAEVMQRAASATATSRPANASRQAATGAANAPANETPETATPASARTATSPARSASATSGQTTATSASAGDIANVVAVYQLLEQQLGKAPSDQKLGDALGVSRSRAQQLRTDAVNAGHTQLAKPMRIAS
jgi:hypothetical protein